MEIVKMILLFGIFSASSMVGILIANQYSERMQELKEMKSALNIFKTKIQFTYEPIAKIFQDIANTLATSCQNVSRIFLLTSKKIQEEQKEAGKAWKESLQESAHAMKQEDIQVLENLANLLGKVDIEGQINEILLVENFVDKQLEKAEIEKQKNSKMYKTLGIMVGLAIVIFLF